MLPDKLPQEPAAARPAAGPRPPEFLQKFKSLWSNLAEKYRAARLQDPNNYLGRGHTLIGNVDALCTFGPFPAETDSCIEIISPLRLFISDAEIPRRAKVTPSAYDVLHDSLSDEAFVTFSMSPLSQATRDSPAVGRLG